ncbi:hypothetical protein PVAND_003709 [Polypedilum vanderplanki]|uniref:Uncharacterized protein n=1 Tax=Polypedilum vanderplanki TaxID=319348 RepID=A0A9J6BUW2_POLVA|nr:hypothetical protein PVAND_003709 [Polypedilum vanderplanki]
MNHSHLSPEAEFRYFLTWFREFSEYEKSDFMNILIQWLLKTNEAHLNGIESNCSKPTIFHCRMKLFREWSSKWNDQLRSKFIEKLNELDPDFVLKMNEMLEAKLEQPEENENVEVAVKDDIEKIENGLTEMSVNEE